MVGGFADNNYWSSSEDTDLLAWGQLFLTGGPLTGAKASTVYVRAVRAF